MNYIGREPAPAGLIMVGDTNPVGMLAFFHSVPDGTWVQLNGQVLIKANYPDLWAYAQGFLTADQVANPGLYKDVSGTTFAVPKLDGLFIRGVGQVDANHVGGALGVKQRDDIGPPSSMPTLTALWARDATAGGVTLSSTGGANTDKLAGVATETRPVNVALVPCVKALKTILMPAGALPVAAQYLGPVALMGAAFR